MKLSLAVASLLFSGAAAVGRGAPKPSLDDGSLDFNIYVPKEKAANTKLTRQETQGEKRRRQRRRLGGKGSETAAPTETPEFWVSGVGIDAVTELLMDSSYNVSPAAQGVSCIDDAACIGTFLNAVATGSPAGSGCAEIAIGLGSQGAASVTVTCPLFDMVATASERICVDTVPLPETLCAANSSVIDVDGVGVTYTLTDEGLHGIIDVKCCFATAP